MIVFVICLSTSLFSSVPSVYSGTFPLGLPRPLPPVPCFLRHSCLPCLIGHGSCTIASCPDVTMWMVNVWNKQIKVPFDSEKTAALIQLRNFKKLSRRTRSCVSFLLVFIFQFPNWAINFSSTPFVDRTFFNSHIYISMKGASVFASSLMFKLSLTVFIWVLFNNSL